MGDTSMQPHPAPLLSRVRCPENTQDWEPYKEIITNLYQRMELYEVMKIMKDQYKFAPTLNQYKKRISKWGLDRKRIKHAEYEAMVKKKRKRGLEAPGKGSQFILHGEEVPQSKITRFEERMQRSGKINEEDTLSDVATPASLMCLTPKPTTLNIAELAGHPMTVDRTLAPGRPQSPDELRFPMPTRIGDKTRPASSSTGVIQSPVVLHRRISSPSPYLGQNEFLPNFNDDLSRRLAIKAAGFEIRPFDWLDFKRIHPTKTLTQMLQLGSESVAETG